MRNILIAAVVLIGTFGTGFYLGRGQVQVEEKIVYKEGETRIIEKEVIREKIIRPDGTIEERVIEKDKDTDSKTRDTETDKSVKPILAQYSLGLGLRVDLGEINKLREVSYENVVITGGRRLLGPLWLDGSVGLDKQITVGVRYEF